MIRNQWIAIFLLLFSVNLFAEDFSVVLQEKNQKLNLFISGNNASSLYKLLSLGVPETPLPQGSYIEGGNLSCLRQPQSSGDGNVICAFRFDKEGLTKEETPTFSTAISSINGKLEIQKMIEKGQIKLSFSGDVADKLFNRLSSLENKEGDKFGKNVFCRKKTSNFECFTMINERGFADFPEEYLKSSSRGVQ